MYSSSLAEACLALWRQLRVPTRLAARRSITLYNEQTLSKILQPECLQMAIAQQPIGQHDVVLATSPAGQTERRIVIPVVLGSQSH